MPGGNICEENLEQRIERIRKRDEEIEKRHREAEADRLAALQANAMVKMTAPADDDWPKAHKYDKLDFTYDVKCEQTDDDKKSTAAAAVDEPRLQRPFKKFPEGQGPPADPTYNFLADAERDGKVQGANNTASENKNWRTNNNGNSGATNSNRRNNANNSSFNRGRNGAKGMKPSDTKKGKSNDEPILRKNDRERNNDQWTQRHQSNDGMWRRSSDDTKEIKQNVSNSPKKGDARQSNFKNDGNHSKANNKQSIQQRMAQSKLETEHMQQKLSDLSIEKRGNITVSVTKDGEVKSVKLETARAIGTGRVGGGASMRQPITPIQPQQQQFVASPPIQTSTEPNFNVATPMNYPIIDQFQPPTQIHHQQQHQQYQQYHVTSVPAQTPTQQIPVQAIVASAMPASKPMSNTVNGVPFKLPSVQDRLIKNRVFFDDKMKNVASSGNGNAVAGNQ